MGVTKISDFLRAGCEVCDAIAIIKSIVLVAFFGLQLNVIFFVGFVFSLPFD